MCSAFVPVVLEGILKRSGQRSKAFMIAAAVLTASQRTLLAQQMALLAHYAYIDARCLKVGGAFVVFEGSKKARSKGGGLMREISPTTMIPSPPIV